MLSQKVKAFENELDLATIVRISRGGRVVGAYLLNKVDAKGKSLDELQLVVGFKCTGIHPLQRPGLEKVIVKKLSNGFKELPVGERFIFRWSSFNYHSDAESYLSQRINNSHSLESEFMDWATLKRVQDLARDHKRNQITLSVYCTFTLGSYADAGDALDKALAWGVDFWQRSFQSRGVEITQKRLVNFLSQAMDATSRYQQILAGMGLNPVVKCDRVMWNELTQRMGAKPTSVPHTLVFDENGIREEHASDNQKHPNPVRVVVGGELHAASHLLNNGTPFADRRWVQRGDKYVGVMALASKPAGFDGDLGQLCFLWEVFSRAEIYDVEVITEVSAADKAVARSAQQFVTRYSITRDKNIQKLGSVDISAQINLDRSTDAQRRLYTGDFPVHVAVVVLVYRDSPSELNDACRMISALVKDPAELTRENEYAWLIWLQTLMVRAQELLLRPFNRRLTFFASEVVGLTNLVKTAEFDQHGFELLAVEGSTPIHIDVAKTDQAMNMMVLGTTGSGKSLLMSQVTAECLASDLSYLMLDLPNDDGVGTFGDFTPFYNGAYFDISKESNNLLQPLDVEHLDSEQKKSRARLHRNDVNLIVSQLVLGSSALDGFLIDVIESLIPLGITAFYQDPVIKERFDRARTASIGSAAWQDTPTLVDLERFYSKEYILSDYEDDEQSRALNHIRLRLRYWRESAIGNAICRPSSFRTDSRLITFALTNIQTGKEAEVFALSAYIAASRQSLASPRSAFFMDEASVLLKYDAFSRLIGRKCATARKSGSRVILAGQDALSIANSAAGEQIIQNISCRLIGRLAPGAAVSTSEILGIPLDIVQQNETFRANQSELYTNWLLHYYNQYVFCRYYPSYPMLALTANARVEQLARQQFKQKHPDKFTMLSEFAKYYVNCRTSGQPLIKKS